MTRIPDAVSVASLDTHRLIVAVANSGHTDVSSNLPPSGVASVLRQIADRYEEKAGQCLGAFVDGVPCPVHDAPASVSEAALDAGRHAADGAADGMRRAQRPAGLDALLDHLAAAMSLDDDQDVDEPEALTAGVVRASLDFNDGDRDQVLATLRDVLLDTTTTRTPEQALAAARILLTAHARQIAALIDAHYRAIRTESGLNRSTRGLLTGYEGARKIVARYADGLADEQALAEAADREQAEQ
ncbi:hypothetical protein KQH21_06615 [Streptomyces sp. IpFD-1.1]|uniref:hypothetical protein n=1 Tax=Streptomyces sp. IpFD-1.1 TaxID=2841664 RepID=UPI00209487F7|nr:hypothetical protein [Streptomyces sp. IpFD-1.1]MCO6747844.1 hypothetical protein [Streptomyces sp. IpFD-1.1]